MWCVETIKIPPFLNAHYFFICIAIITRYNYTLQLFFRPFDASNEVMIDFDVLGKQIYNFKIESV